jgi:hypothetical protein
MKFLLFLAFFMQIPERKIESEVWNGADSYFNHVSPRADLKNINS